MHQRKKNRLTNFDYSKNGWYFVTICTKNNIKWFGKVGTVGTALELSVRAMQLNEVGEVVQQQWVWLAEQYPYVELDEFIVMPNHVHGIVIINECGFGRDNSRVVRTGEGIKIHSLSRLIGAFKTTSSKKIHELGYENFRWHRSFHDHIISSDRALENIRSYIKNNPAVWQEKKNKRNYPNRGNNGVKASIFLAEK